MTKSVPHTKELTSSEESDGETPSLSNSHALKRGIDNSVESFNSCFENVEISIPPASRIGRAVGRRGGSVAQEQTSGVLNL